MRSVPGSRLDSQIDSFLGHLVVIADLCFGLAFARQQAGLAQPSGQGGVQALGTVQLMSQRMPQRCAASHADKLMAFLILLVVAR